jgi:hypothetical protein
MAFRELRTSGVDIASDLKPLVTIGFERHGDSPRVALIPPAAYVLTPALPRLLGAKESETHVDTVGMAGRADGELLQPVTVVSTDSGRLFVLDLAHHIQEFRASTFDFVRAIRLTHSPNDICVIGSTVVASGTFASLYHSPNVLVNRMIQRSKIACSSADSTILLAPENGLAELRAYTIRGRPRWIARIDGFMPVAIRELVEGSRLGVRVSVPAEGYHRVRTVLYDARLGFVVQYAFLSDASAKAGRDYDRLTTVTLDPATGLITASSDELPLVVAIARTRVAIVRPQSPSIVQVFARVGSQ